MLGWVASCLPEPEEEGCMASACSRCQAIESLGPPCCPCLLAAALADLSAKPP